MSTEMPKTVQQWERENAQRRLRVNAEGLRRLAESFDRAADSLAQVPSAGKPNHVGVAAYVLHEHAVWLMNAQLQSAVEYAASADVAMVRGE